MGTPDVTRRTGIIQTATDGTLPHRDRTTPVIRNGEVLTGQIISTHIPRIRTAILLGNSPHHIDRMLEQTRTDIDNVRATVPELPLVPFLARRLLRGLSGFSHDDPNITDATLNATRRLLTVVFETIEPQQIQKLFIDTISQHSRPFQTANVAALLDTTADIHKSLPREDKTVKVFTNAFDAAISTIDDAQEREMLTEKRKDFTGKLIDTIVTGLRGTWIEKDILRIALEHPNYSDAAIRQELQSAHEIADTTITRALSKLRLNRYLSEPKSPDEIEKILAGQRTRVNRARPN